MADKKIPITDLRADDILKYNLNALMNIDTHPTDEELKRIVNMSRDINFTRGLKIDILRKLNYTKEVIHSIHGAKTDFHILKKSLYYAGKADAYKDIIVTGDKAEERLNKRLNKKHKKEKEQEDAEE